MDGRLCLTYLDGRLCLIYLDGRLYLGGLRRKDGRLCLIYLDGRLYLGGLRRMNELGDLNDPSVLVGLSDRGSLVFWNLNVLKNRSFLTSRMQVCPYGDLIHYYFWQDSWSYSRGDCWTCRLDCSVY